MRFESSSLGGTGSHRITVIVFILLKRQAGNEALCYCCALHFLYHSLVVAARHPKSWDRHTPQRRAGSSTAMDVLDGILRAFVHWRIRACDRGAWITGFFHPPRAEGISTGGVGAELPYF